MFSPEHPYAKGPRIEDAIQVGKLAAYKILTGFPESDQRWLTAPSLSYTLLDRFSRPSRLPLDASEVVEIVDDLGVGCSTVPLFHNLKKVRLISLTAPTDKFVIATYVYEGDCDEKVSVPGKGPLSVSIHLDYYSEMTFPSLWSKTKHKIMHFLILPRSNLLHWKMTDFQHTATFADYLDWLQENGETP